MKKPVHDVISKTAELFQDNLNQHYFSLETPHETKMARRLQEKFINIDTHHKVLFFPGMRKQLKNNDSDFLKKYDKSLRGFKELAEECTESRNIKTLALCASYFYEFSLWHDALVQPDVQTRKKAVFNTYFKKTEKMLSTAIDQCHPERHDRNAWNAKNFALMAYASAKHQRENPPTREEISKLAERLLGDKGPMPPS